MALIAMTTHDTVDYVSDLDPSKKYDVPPADDGALPIERTFTVDEGATVFKLKPLDVFLMGHIYDSASIMRGIPGSGDVGVQTKMNATNIEAVRHGLAGFVNFTDAKGGQVVFKTQKAVVNGRPYEVVDDSVMTKLGIRLVQELGQKVKAISEVGKAEEKNSAGA